MNVVRAPRLDRRGAAHEPVLASRSGAGHGSGSQRTGDVAVPAAPISPLLNGVKPIVATNRLRVTLRRPGLQRENPGKKERS
jgi:hypothetical protein